MRVFIATSFDDLNRHRARSVAELLETIGVETCFGEELHGGSVSTEVKQRIELSNCLIALFTRRNRLSNNGWATSPWVIEEATWAMAKGIKVLRVLEDGVRTGGIAGDVEEVRFKSAAFETALVRIVKFVANERNRIPNYQQPEHSVERVTVMSVVPTEPIEDDWGAEVRELVEKIRQEGEARSFEEALRLCERTLSLAPACWRALVSKGVALVHLGRLREGEAAFDLVAEQFAENGEAVAKALHNKAWVLELRNGTLHAETLRKRKDLYLRSLALDNRRLMTRAQALICMALLNETEEANQFLRSSLRWRGFTETLRDELDIIGRLGHDVLNQLPDWLRDILYPGEGSQRPGEPG